MQPMKIYRCKERLEIPTVDRNGKRRDAIATQVGHYFTAEDDQNEPVRLEGTRGARLMVSRATLEKHFEEIA